MSFTEKVKEFFAGVDGVFSSLFQEAEKLDTDPKVHEILLDAEEALAEVLERHGMPEALAEDLIHAVLNMLEDAIDPETLPVKPQQNQQVTPPSSK